MRSAHIAHIRPQLQRLLVRDDAVCLATRRREPLEVDCQDRRCRVYLEALLRNDQLLTPVCSPRQRCGDCSLRNSVIVHSLLALVLVLALQHVDLDEILERVLDGSRGVQVEREVEDRVESIRVVPAGLAMHARSQSPSEELVHKVLLLDLLIQFPVKSVVGSIARPDGRRKYGYSRGSPVERRRLHRIDRES